MLEPASLVLPVEVQDFNPSCRAFFFLLVVVLLPSSLFSHIFSSSRKESKKKKKQQLLSKWTVLLAPLLLSWFKHFKCPEEKKEKFPSAQQSFPSSFLGCGFFMLSLFLRHDVLRSLFSPSRKSRSDLRSGVTFDATKRRRRRRLEEGICIHSASLSFLSVSLFHSKKSRPNLVFKDRIVWCFTNFLFEEVSKEEEG